MPRFKIIKIMVPKKKIVKVWVILGQGGHFGHVTEIHVTLHIKFGFDMQNCLAPRQG